MVFRLACVLLAVLAVRETDRPGDSPWSAPVVAGPGFNFKWG
jgi:hypothetical protein